MTTSTRGSCFLCHPDERLVYLREGSFFAMLGLGPLMEGYSLIATRQHIASMLDLDDAEAAELGEFTALVRQHLEQRYPPASVAEHGRVAPCVHAATVAHDPHCLHAHRLVFPGVASIDLTQAARDVETYEDFRTACQNFDWPGQYLYSEAPDGRCQISVAPGRLPRQFLRGLVAREVGSVALADWRSHPRLEVVEAGRQRLALAA